MTLKTKVIKHLEAIHQGPDADHLFPRLDWMYEVENGDTTASFDDWRSSQIEAEAETAASAVDRLVRKINEKADQKDINHAAIDMASDLRMMDSDFVVAAGYRREKNHQEWLFGERCCVVPADVRAEIEAVASAAVAGEDLDLHDMAHFLCKIDMAEESSEDPAP